VKELGENNRHGLDLDALEAGNEGAGIAGGGSSDLCDHLSVSPHVDGSFHAEKGPG